MSTAKGSLQIAGFAPRTDWPGQVPFQRGHGCSSHRVSSACGPRPGPHSPLGNLKGHPSCKAPWSGLPVSLHCASVSPCRLRLSLGRPRGPPQQASCRPRCRECSWPSRSAPRAPVRNAGSRAPPEDAVQAPPLHSPPGKVRELPLGASEVSGSVTQCHRSVTPGGHSPRTGWWWEEEEGRVPGGSIPIVSVPWSPVLGPGM